MDLKTFGENDFDHKKWINKAWSSSGNQELEFFVANTVGRLQLYMKQLSNSLDETTTQIVTSLPRVLQDAAVLHEEGVLLQQKLLALEEKVEAVEKQTGHSIVSLQRIDNLKCKLENAAAALNEADKWAVLSTSLENILESGVPTYGAKLNDLSNQVTAMTQSLEVLSDASDYDSKRVQLETLYNRLEAAISPPLIDALTQMDADRVGVYVKMLRGMGRETSVCRCWRRAAAARVVSSWRRGHQHSMPELTKLLASDAAKQIEWLANVLKSDTPLAELIRLYTDLLLSLEPSPTKLATSNIKLCTNAEEGVLFLCDVRRDIDQFVSTIEAILDNPTYSQEYVEPMVQREVGRAAFAPLRGLLPAYTALETQLLQAQLGRADLKYDDLMEYARALVTVSERCGGWLEAAFVRSKKIAGLAAYPFYVPAVENFISSVTTLISAHSRRIEGQFLTSVSAGEATGVLSETFGASLLLENAASILLDTIIERHQLEAAEPELEDPRPLHDLPTLLLEPDGKQKLAAFRADPPLSVANLRRAKEHLTTLSKNILKEPVDTQLDKIPSLTVWSNNEAFTADLPDYALSPQEYITEVGQYLMTLPQHLEMHMTEKQAPWQYLSEICIHTCETYAQKILSIRNMDQLGTKRCLTDIVYLSSVVEDLGTNVTPALKSLESSLRVATPHGPYIGPTVE